MRAPQGREPSPSASLRLQYSIFNYVNAPARHQPPPTLRQNCIDDTRITCVSDAPLPLAVTSNCTMPMYGERFCSSV